MVSRVWVYAPKMRNQSWFLWACEKRERHLLTRDTIDRENKEMLNENTSVNNDVKCITNMLILLICNVSTRLTPRCTKANINKLKLPGKNSMKAKLWISEMFSLIPLIFYYFRINFSYPQPPPKPHDFWFSAFYVCPLTRPRTIPKTHLPHSPNPWNPALC